MLLGVAVATVSAGLSPTRWAALVGGALIGSARWRSPCARTAGRSRAGRYETAHPPTVRHRARDTWDALDRGEDPTA